MFSDHRDVLNVFSVYRCLKICAASQNIAKDEDLSNDQT